MVERLLRYFGRRAPVPVPVPAPAVAATPPLETAGACLQSAEALIAQRQWEPALAQATSAAALEPANPAIHALCGNLLHRLGRVEEAISAYDRALALRPELADVHYNRGVVLQQAGRSDAALASYAAAVTLRPDLYQAHYNTGNLLRVLQRPREALASYDAALAIRADYPEALTNRGVVQQELGQWDAALASYAAAVAVRPEHAEAHFNRATLLEARGDEAAAIASYDAALALRPDYAEARYNRALALLRRGDLAAGFRDYEWRWANAARLALPDRQRYGKPGWQAAESPAGQRILVFCEQGLGDTLQFCRYLPLLAKRGAEVIVEVPPPLVRLFACLPGVSRLLTEGEALPEFDLQCPVMSLPHLLQAADPMPQRVPYIHGDAAASAAWRQRLGPRTRPRVGLVWSGGFRGTDPRYLEANGRRNIALARLAPLANPRLEFHSVQKGAAAEAELAQLRAAGWAGPDIADHAALLTDFAETAALIENLDLVISVDTSTAHLAAAMGKPVWLLNRYDTCWRWLQGRDDSPWYPTLRLYRQPAPGDWDEPVSRIAADLSSLASRGS